LQFKGGDEIAMGLSLFVEKKSISRTNPQIPDIERLYFGSVDVFL